MNTADGRPGQAVAVTAQASNLHDGSTCRNTSRAMSTPESRKSTAETSMVASASRSPGPGTRRWHRGCAVLGDGRLHHCHRARRIGSVEARHRSSLSRRRRGRCAAPKRRRISSRRSRQARGLFVVRAPGASRSISASMAAAQRLPTAHPVFDQRRRRRRLRAGVGGSMSVRATSSSE